MNASAVHKSQHALAGDQETIRCEISYGANSLRQGCRQLHGQLCYVYGADAAARTTAAMTDVSGGGGGGATELGHVTAGARW